MFSKAKNITAEHKTTPSGSSDSRAALLSGTSNSSNARPSTSVIGSHTQVEGDISSDEDLTVKGRVSGIITCKQHTVTLSANSYLKGNVFAHTLHVSGEVEGNLVASHRATIHKGAQVTGTIVSPCLVLEDGSIFHGSIDMSADNELLKSSFCDAPVEIMKPSASSSTAEHPPLATTSDKHLNNSSSVAEQAEA
ncbi:bactofilin family protein [Vreelandella populi]|uniref:Polymer-forming cytoskeletal protein n=1 Tax=Vreelandella populi TaxID=2498858 RepID=A0A433LFZ7_9GAMM|nr:polymer-forming cytoskeletal protein [Halomonas populi]RUR37916.1 polymer-forming cytoskeletal protein [Halomonas populi]RUR48894.1 polymer-forming cytoskeletal protein [Halomonas populi]RUR55238.1 polymer-forming cytoskeletal protein [Halomonas populi]